MTTVSDYGRVTDFRIGEVTGTDLAPESRAGAAVVRGHDGRPRRAAVVRRGLGGRGGRSTTG
ncbi:hypothetical protein [Streptomyces ipomoeae]|uniref:hypothetical protein n=1 Tax=Streptomyces ipomoeae TaxID=103232 RepID=UPI0015EFF0BD|nr:hypothetical protein [Streptomyces ipomoeae]